MSLTLVFAGPLVVAFVGCFWFFGIPRAVAENNRLSVRFLLTLLYGLAFVIGEWYLIVLVAGLKWPRAVAFLGIVSWGVLLSSGARWRHLRRNRNSQTPSD